jgi:hypothetical protein
MYSGQVTDQRRTFNPGTSITVAMNVDGTGSGPATCTSGGTTAETNNLTLSGTCASGYQANQVDFREALAPALCPALTAAMLPWGLSNSYLQLDDEGLASTPGSLYLGSLGASNTFTGTIYGPDGATSLPVSGTVSGTGTLTVSFSFTLGASPFIGTSYTYTGALASTAQAEPNGSCPVFIAGTYTSTYYTVQEIDGFPSFVRHTSAPLPFSGKLASSPGT